MTTQSLAILGGAPVRERSWPLWPRAQQSTIAAVVDVLQSTRWAVSGPYDGRTAYERRFAEAFATFEGVSYCTPTTSGTAALTIALEALGVGRGDEVLVPAMTWVACASAVVHLGATPVLVDCDDKSLAMNAVRARERLTERTAAILVVHPFCQTADLDAFVELANHSGTALIEDCAQAHGACWRGRRVGSYGSVGCFSMQQSKLLTAGEGGCVVTDDPALYDRAEQLRCDGRRFVDEPVVGQLELIEVGDVLGRNLCLSEIQAAILLDRLQVLDDENEWRAARARYLEELLEGVEGVSSLPSDERVTNPTYYNFVLRFDLDQFAQCSIDVLGSALSAELGLRVNPLYAPLRDHPLLASVRGMLKSGELDHAKRARRSCLTIGHPAFLDDGQSMEDIVSALVKVQANAACLQRQVVQPSRLSF